MSELTTFARGCEAIIASVDPKPFLPAQDRDRWRVYAMAKLAGIVESGRDVEEMLVAAPGLYESLLRGFQSLVSGRGLLWWQSRENAKEKAWPRCVRDAIFEVAGKLEVGAKELAAELDAGAYPHTRALIIRIAERNLLRDRK